MGRGVVDAIHGREAPLSLANLPTPQPKSIAILPMPPPDPGARAPRAIFDVRQARDGLLPVA